MNEEIKLPVHVFNIPKNTILKLHHHYYNDKNENIFIHESVIEKYNNLNYILTSSDNHNLNQNDIAYVVHLESRNIWKTIVTNYTTLLTTNNLIFKHFDKALECLRKYLNIKLDDMIFNTELNLYCGKILDFIYINELIVDTTVYTLAINNNKYTNKIAVKCKNRYELKEILNYYVSYNSEGFDIDNIPLNHNCICVNEFKTFDSKTHVSIQNHYIINYDNFVEQLTN